MKLTAALFAAVWIVATCADPVQASWQYTKWGMTAEQVKAASEGKAVALETGEDKDDKGETEMLLKAPYTSGKFQFLAYFVFQKTDSKLCGVVLELQNVKESDNLLLSLIDKYGTPDADSQDEQKRHIPLAQPLQSRSHKSWLTASLASRRRDPRVWRTPTDQIEYSRSKDHRRYTSVAYWPPIDADNSGL